MLSSTLVFIDAHLEAYQSLAESAATAAEVVVLDADRDGIAQITDALADRRNLTSVHIFSHGAPGVLHLGSDYLSFDSDREIDRLKRWKTALADSADLLIYGCQVAAGDRGRRFLQQLRRLTGANVAASTTPTGNADLGGDWELDRQIGKITAAPVLSKSAMATYSGVMALCVPNLLYSVSNTDSDPSRSEVDLLDVTNAKSSTIGTLAFTTFNLARQGLTGRLYYTEEPPNSRVAYWDPATQQNTILPNRTGVDATFFKLGMSSDGIGTIYGFDADTTNLYAIDPNTGVANLRGTVAGNGFSTGSGDLAFNPRNPNQMFVSVAGADVPEQFYRIYTVDLTTLQATLVGDTGLPDQGSGAMAFGQDGNLYVTSEDKLYRINPATATPTLVGTTNNVFNDFATLPTPTAEVDLTISKTDNLDVVSPGNSVTYTIEVTNTTADCDINDITVQDLISDQVTGITWSAVITGTGSFVTPGDRSGTGNSVISKINLGAQAKVIYTVQGTVSPNSALGSTLANTATVTLPPGVNDPNPGSNTTTDTTKVVVAGEEPPDLGCVPGVNRVGNAENNVLLGDSDMNRLNGRGGNDTLRGYGCPDLLLGGQGDDTLWGGSGRDNLQGQQGNDRLHGYRGSDRLNGGLGDDQLFGGINNDSLRGGRGNDWLKGDDGTDRLLGNDGSDRLAGGAGDDVVRGQLNDDVIFGGAGNDQLDGVVGNDRIFAGAGNDVVRAGRGDDRVFGAEGDDQLLGGELDDRLYGGAGRDFMRGQQNDDRLFGDQGADQLFGGIGSDILDGGNGNDILNGGGGADVLKGGGGADTLIGKFADDVITGGGGADRFVYRSGADGTDRIVDFDRQDVIDVSGVFAAANYRSSNRFVRYIDLQQSGSSTIVRLDFNGDRSGGLRSVLTLENVSARSLNARSFVLT